MSDVNDGLGWLGARGRDGGIDTIPLPRAPGGLSRCGKHAIGPDHHAAMARGGATTVVCLVEAPDLDDRYPEYLDWVRTNQGSQVVWFPIHDLHAPTVERALDLLTDLLARLERGEHLLVHCAAGIGRAGTVATCLLIEMGLGQEAALAHVAAHRPMAGPEVGAQTDLVRALASRVR
jgi:protein-tyrosine phosphatase